MTPSWYSNHRNLLILIFIVDTRITIMISGLPFIRIVIGLKNVAMNARVPGLFIHGVLIKQETGPARRPLVKTACIQTMMRLMGQSVSVILYGHRKPRNHFPTNKPNLSNENFYIARNILPGFFFYMKHVIFVVVGNGGMIIGGRLHVRLYVASNGAFPYLHRVYRSASPGKWSMKKI